MEKNLLSAALLIIAFIYSGCSSSIDSETSSEPPEANRFSHHVVVSGLDQPMQIDFDRQGYVYWVERTGGVKRIHEETGQVDLLGEIPLYDGRAPGMIGILLDQDFEQTRQLYLFFSAAEDDGEKMRLSRFTVNSEDAIDMESEMVILEVPWRQPDGSHMGGGMVWDKEGNLYLSIGDATAPSQFAPIHLNEDGSIQDAAATAGNTNDLRGSILRITPQPDGSYTIPDGNLFSEDTPYTRPEIYVMGTRNPWRLSIDSQTGYLHWGDVGPDAGADSDVYGPAGVDELNVARHAGNFGWPFVYGNRPYNRYDYNRGTYGEPHDPQAPVNESPNNTGLRELPPAQPALVAYPYGVSEEWPILGSAARSVVGGPVFRRADFPPDAPRVFPSYYEGKWLVTDYSRTWIMVVTMNEERTEAVDIDRFLPGEQLIHSQPLDMDFGPTGDLYIIEYGVGTTGRISRIEYNDGNRAPVARASANQTSGATPLELQLSSEGSVDYDGDELQYEWTVRPEAGGETHRFTRANPAVTLETAGRYKVELRVTDPEGASDIDSFEIVAGNERPEVNLEITRGNRSFYFPDATIDYQVQVSDPEDGSLSDGGISPGRVSMTVEYIPSGLSPGQLAELQDEGGIEPGLELRHLQARSLIHEHNCNTCHQVASESVGPSFTAIAERNDELEESPGEISQSFIEGSTGKWGEVPMPPNPMITEAEARQITDFILSLAQTDDGPQTLPLQGSYTTKAYENRGDNDRLMRFFSPSYELGSYVFHVHYTDQGSEELAGLELTDNELLLLRYPLLAPETADFYSDKGISFSPSTNDPGFILSGPASYFGFEQIDLTEINQINIGALTRFYQWSHFIGAMVEIRLDSPEGILVGEPQPQFQPDTLTAEDGPFFGDDLDPPVEVDVSQINGKHDIYLIFRNSDAGANDALVVITGIEFKQ